MYGLSIYLVTFKDKIKVIEFLMGSIFWTVHVNTKVYMKRIQQVIYGLLIDLMIFDGLYR